MLRKTAAVIASVALMLGTAVGFGSAAVAASNQVNIDSITFVTEEGVQIDEFRDGTKQWLDIQMSIPGDAVVPVSGTIPLPGELRGEPETITLYAPDGTPNGTCTVSTTSVYCELDDDYVEEHPQNMEGFFKFEVTVINGNTEDETVRFPIVDNFTNEVTIRPGGSQCEEDCELDPEDGSKIGWYDKTDDTIGWEVRVPTPGSDGMEIGVPVTVIDEIDTSIYEVLPGSPYVEYFDVVVVEPDGREELNFYSRTFLPEDEFTVSKGGTQVDFITATGNRYQDPTLPEGERGLKGRVYWVTWKVQTLDHGAQGTYRNSATIIVGDDGERTEVDGSVTNQSGSGGAVGTNQGRLAFEKEITGTAERDPDLPTAYGVNYKACDTTKPGYNHASHSGPGCMDGTLTLRPGKTTWSSSFPAGTRVVGEEVTPTEPENVVWDGEFQLVDASGNPIPGSEGDSVFDVTFTSANGNLGALTFYRVTNEANYEEPSVGAFSARKVLVDANGLAPSGLADFRLNYTYPAAADGSFPAGSGTLLLPANGEVKTSGELPVGAILTLTESTPPAVPGGVWGTASVVPSTLTITADGQSEDPVNVVVTNTLLPAPAPGFVVGKSSDPANGESVAPGDVITYTVTGSNTGNTRLNPVTITDDLDDLWDYVTYNGDAFATIDGTTSAGTLNTDPKNAQLGWTGALNARETVTITYSVTVKPNAFGEVLENRVTGTAVPPVGPPITPPPGETEHPVPVPGFTLGKTANPPHGSEVNPGDTITYTLTGVNTGGTILDPVEIHDDLSGLSEYVTFNDDAFATIDGTTDAGVLTLDKTTGKLDWAGALKPGETVTVTYSVTVNPNAIGQELQNAVTGSAQPPGPGVPPITPPPTDTEHSVPTPGFELTKVANPADRTEVHPGQIIKYTVVGTNTGETVLDPVVIEDDLTGVLEFATYNNDHAATIDGSTPAGTFTPEPVVTNLVWTGVLDPGESVTITYSVTVAENAVGHTLENRVTGAGTPPGLPPIEPPPVDTEHPVPTPGFVLGKTSVPRSGADVNPGEKITFTVTGRNTGGTVLDPVTILDEMAGLSDYTTYNNDAEAKINGTGPAGTLTPDLDEATLLWTGALAPGETVTITYSVTVNENAVGELLENHVSGSATPPGPERPPIIPPPVDTEHTVPTPGFELGKSADPVSGTTVHPGDTITYTVTGKNTGGTILNPVVINDDLSGLSEYVTYNDDAAASINGTDPAGTLTHDPEAATLLWTGVLAEGETVTITYSVTVNADASGETLNNHVSGTATPPGLPPIVPPPVDTEHQVPTPGFELGKSANPENGTAVHPGDTITYTVSGINTGETVLDPVVITDDLSGLSEHVTYNEDAAASINGTDPAGTLVPGEDGESLVWTGVLAPGETVTITYSVTVNQDASGALLRNRVSGEATPPGLPPIEPPPGETEHPVPTPGFELGKSADPASGTVVLPGSRITYTVTGANTGETVLDPVVIEDDMAGLWEFVTYNDDAVATINGFRTVDPVVDPEEATLVWTGALAAGQTVEITYSVTVNQNAGGELLENRVTASAQPPGLPPITPPPADTEHPVPPKPESPVVTPPTVTPGDPAGTPPPGGLATTGSQSPLEMLFLAALLLMLGGAVMLRRARAGSPG
ncbi:DUF7507 domain-containing protein [Mycetocola lacteus]|uniref:DUF7927 domain-containing protein n=1 Tax=Mycetocola lacteus TaxID=76637 RepID=UPI00160492A7|nr:isopeptide-forming domain-containing fimbrial protein [Mycetocola lacteus]